MTTHNTFTIERSYPAATPERVFQAFSDPVQKIRWYAEGGPGHDLEEYEFDFRVGGKEVAKSRFKEGSPFPGVAMIAENIHLDIVPLSRVIVASTMTVGDRRISASLITFEIQPEGAGSKLTLTHQSAFFEFSDGPERRKEGWEVILDRMTGVL